MLIGVLANVTADARAKGSLETAANDTDPAVKAKAQAALEQLK